MLDFFPYFIQISLILNLYSGREGCVSFLPTHPLSLSHYVTGTISFFLFLAYIRLILESVLCLLFSLPRTLFPQIYTWLAPSYHIEFCRHGVRFSLIMSLLAYHSVLFPLKHISLPEVNLFVDRLFLSPMTRIYSA